MKVSCVVTAHADPDAMWRMVDIITQQSLRPHEVLVYASDIDLTALAGYTFHHGTTTTFTVVENRNDWGHEKRARGLADATGDVVGFFNHDDLYAPTYLEEMVRALEDSGADLAHCTWTSHLSGNVPVVGEPRVGHITSGNFLVRTALAQQVGYLHRDYEADGRFIEDVMATGATHVQVPSLLYTHL